VAVGEADWLRPGERIRPAALTPNAPFPFTIGPVRLSMLAAINCLGFCLCAVTLALRVTRYDPAESIRRQMPPSPDDDDEPYPREWE
jgi:hypothetical protein